GGHPDEGMARFVAHRIGLGFDDPAARPVATVIANEQLADEKPRQIDRVFRQLRTTQSTSAPDGASADDGGGAKGHAVLPATARSSYMVFSSSPHLCGGEEGKTTPMAWCLRHPRPLLLPRGEGARKFLSFADFFTAQTPRTDEARSVYSRPLPSRE